MKEEMEKVERNMVARRKVLLLLSSFLVSLFIFNFSANAANVPIIQTVPCTYVGRLMDAEHVGFDTNRVAEIAAYDESGNKIAESRTFYRADSRRNYALRIPMASQTVDGTQSPEATVEIEVTEPNGKVWSGLVVDPDATLGGPGSVKEVDIVLASSTKNNYGLDDDLYEDLYWAWRYSPYFVSGETFDPTKDHDGDGMSTLAEAFSGTNPFDPNDRLAILSFKRIGQGGVVEKDLLSFACRPGRSYWLEVTESLENPNWKQKAFMLDESGKPINYISVPAAGSSEETPTVYLLPESGKKAFYRIKAD